MKSLLVILCSIKLLLIHCSIKQIIQDIQYERQLIDTIDDNDFNRSLIVKNSYLDSSIRNTLLTVKNVYYFANDCVECIQLICKSKVNNTIYKKLTNITRLSRLAFFELLGNNLKESQMSTIKLRRLNVVENIKRAIAGLVNTVYPSIHNCASKNTYKTIVKKLRKIIENHNNKPCATTLYLKQSNDDYLAWKKELCSWLDDEERKCLSEMKFNQTEIDDMNVICNDDD